MPYTIQQVAEITGLPASTLRFYEAEGLLPREEAIDAMADTRTPQGVIAVCRQFPSSIRDALSGSPKLVAILEEVRDPGNLGRTR